MWNVLSSLSGWRRDGWFARAPIRSNVKQQSSENPGDVLDTAQAKEEQSNVDHFQWWLERIDT